MPSLPRFLDPVGPECVDEDSGDQPTANEPGVCAPDSGPSGINRVTDGSESSRCRLWLGAGEEFIQLIKADWYRVADWYR